MPTTQSNDPHEQVDHPRHYNQHPSGIEAIEIIEHLPFNLGNAVKYIWRAGLKASSKPLRDLQSAQWYVQREIERRERFQVSPNRIRTGPVWRSLAGRIVAGADSGDLLAECLDALLTEDLSRMLFRIKREIETCQAT